MRKHTVDALMTNQCTFITYDITQAYLTNMKPDQMSVLSHNSIIFKGLAFVLIKMSSRAEVVGISCV